jgi:hypothetical protein
MRKDKAAPPPPPEPLTASQYETKPAVKLPSLIPYKEELFPTKVKKSKKERATGRPWRVDYDLTYEGGGAAAFQQYYRTRQGAILSAFFHKFVRSYGGTAILFHQPTERHATR